MDCRECKYYVGDIDETTDCYQERCPYIEAEIQDEDWRHESPKLNRD